MHAEDVRREVVELVASGRIEDAIIAVQTYLWSDVQAIPHIRNRLNKLERLGIVCGTDSILFDRCVYWRQDLCGLPGGRAVD